MDSVISSQQNPLLSKSFHFAVQIIRICKEIHAGSTYLLANQLLKSGTSIGANIREAQASESRADFVHKLKIVYKESEETEYWLMLLKESDVYTPSESTLTELEEIKKILSKSISTAKLTLNNKARSQ